MTQSGQTRGIFVGREREMAELVAALDSSMAGRGRLVMLAGEPGIGKTRIAQELASHAQSLGAHVLWGWCYEREGAPPYWPWVQPIQSYVIDTVPDKLLGEMGPGASDIADLIPEIREKLPGLDPPPELDPQQTRFRLFNSVSTFLKNLAQSQALVLVLDDLHWADSSSLLLLEFLAGQIAESKILVIGSYRDIEVTRQHPLSESLAQLSRSPAYQRIVLGGLDSEDAGLFVRTAGVENASIGLITAIHSHTEGNPLFMTEVIRLLGEQRLLEASSGAGAPEALGLPQGVREVIGQRLNRLSEECVGVLTTAAVIGRQFDFRLLGYLSEDTAESRLLELVDEALEAHILQELPGQGDRYEFSHALVQQTLLERLSTSRKVRMHARIVGELETIYGDQPGEHAAELAYHFSEASPVMGPDKLVKYSGLAGERALEGYAWDEAFAHFKNGLIGMSVDVEGSMPAPNVEGAALLFGLGRSQMALLDDDAYRSLRRAMDYYAGSGDLEKVVAIAELPDYAATRSVGLEQLVAPALLLVPVGSLQSGRLLSRYGQIIAMQDAAYDEAIDALNQALEIARREGDEALEVQSLAAVTSVHATHMRYDEVLASGLKLIELNKRVHDPRSEVSAHYFVVTSLVGNGELGAAKRHLSEMLSQAERLGDRFWLEGACWKTGMTLRLTGEWDTARSFGQRALEIGARQSNSLNELAMLEHELGNSRHGDSYLDLLTEIASEGIVGSRLMDLSAYARVASTVPIVARITGVADGLKSAINAAAHVLEHPQATAVQIGQSHTGLAMIAVLSGDAESAAKQYEIMKVWRHKHLSFSISADRLLGLLAQTMEQLDQALIHFEEALTFCRKGGYRPELAWTCCDYADSLLQRNGEGDRAKAKLLLEESLAISSGLGMRPLIDRVAARQERAESQPAQRPLYPDGLTQREVEVIRLIAAGKTDREIAGELIISINTVYNHVKNILNKTNAANRTEAASYATRAGLTGDADTFGERG